MCVSSMALSMPCAHACKFNACMRQNLRASVSIKIGVHDFRSMQINLLIEESFLLCGDSWCCLLEIPDTGCRTWHGCLCAS
jgi:hypothetical protein